MGNPFIQPQPEKDKSAMTLASQMAEIEKIIKSDVGFIIHEHLFHINISGSGGTQGGGSVEEHGVGRYPHGVEQNQKRSQQFAESCGELD